MQRPKTQCVGTLSGRGEFVFPRPRLLQRQQLARLFISHNSTLLGIKAYIHYDIHPASDQTARRRTIARNATRLLLLDLTGAAAAAAAAAVAVWSCS